MNFSEFLQDNTGNSSAIRLATLLWIVGVLFVWIYTCLNSSEPKIVPIDGTVITLIGILITGKVVQKYAEDSKPAQDTQNSQTPQDPACVSANNQAPVSIPTPPGAC